MAIAAVAVKYTYDYGEERYGCPNQSNMHSSKDACGHLAEALAAFEGFHPDEFSACNTVPSDSDG